MVLSLFCLHRMFFTTNRLSRTLSKPSERGLVTVQTTEVTRDTFLTRLFSPNGRRHPYLNLALERTTIFPREDVKSIRKRWTGRKGTEKEPFFFGFSKEDIRLLTLRNSLVTKTQFFVYLLVWFWKYRFQEFGSLPVVTLNGVFHLIYFVYLGLQIK